MSEIAFVAERRKYWEYLSSNRAVFVGSIMAWRMMY
jgi:hypothetical protein